MTQAVRVALFLLIFSLVSIAQGNAEQHDGWGRIQASKDDFTVRLPIGSDLHLYEGNLLNVQDRNQGLPKLYLFENEEFYLFVTSSEIRRIPIVDELLRFIRESSPNTDSVNFGNYNGARSRFEDTEGYLHYSLVIDTKTRKFVFHGVSKTPDTKSLERVFSSLEVHGQYGRQTKRTSKVTAEKMVTVFKPSLVNCDSRIYKPWDEIGQGSGCGTGVNPLHIYAKPRACSTELARYYFIQGTVKLNVEFLPGGGIGHIKAIEKLPFGLTNNAVAAARKLLFVPEQNNCKSVATTRQISYTFLAY